MNRPSFLAAIAALFGAAAVPASAALRTPFVTRRRFPHLRITVHGVVGAKAGDVVVIGSGGTVESVVIQSVGRDSFTFTVPGHCPT